MDLSFKDIQFIIEAIDNLVNQYEERLNNSADLDEDEASDLGNDTMFLQALRTDLATRAEQDFSPKDNKLLQKSEGFSLQELIDPVMRLPINQRLVLVDAITESIRQELSVSKS